MQFPMRSRPLTVGADILIGSIGGDDLFGGGGADVFHAGAGVDVITVPDLSFRLVDGCLGTDKLVLTGNGATFNFSTLLDGKVQGIETIDFTGSGNNALTLSINDVLQLSDTPNASFTGAASHNSLVVLGDLGDTLNLEGEVLVDDNVALDGVTAGGFDIYNLVRNSVVVASIAVDHDVLLV